jgi:hypothetical protein
MFTDTPSNPPSNRNWPELLTPDQAVEYYVAAHNVRTTIGTLAVKRSQGRGICYRKLFGRVYYRRDDIDQSVNDAQRIETLKS